jgi:hypothetical protein
MVLTISKKPSHQMSFSRMEREKRMPFTKWCSLSENEFSLKCNSACFWRKVNGEIRV